MKLIGEKSKLIQFITYTGSNKPLFTGYKGVMKRLGVYGKGEMETEKTQRLKKGRKRKENISSYKLYKLTRWGRCRYFK